MAILVTGAAGFIGYHVAQALLARGETVVGLDNLNDYYDPALKQARLANLQTQANFSFRRVDIGRREDVLALAEAAPRIERIVHLAAHAGVRHSLLDPTLYIQTNIAGHLHMLELARALPDFRHLVYASTSSVYGDNPAMPHAEDASIANPVSIYGVSKTTNELTSACYSHVYGLPQTGLRFFTVYGPWGRPDMAYYVFTQAIFEGRKLQVFNNGDMKRDFTWIDDIVAGVIAALDHPPAAANGALPHRIYNIGNHRAEPLMEFIAIIERAAGRKAELEFIPMQDGDVKETYADITAISRDLGYMPSTSIEVGLPKFVDWYRAYHRV